MADEDAIRNSSHDSGVSVVKVDDETLEQTTEKDNSLPVVFQCSQCNSILGDSLSWVGANPIMRTITIKNITSKVGVREAVHISTAGTDAGSTYNSLFCEVCKEEFGKKYLASPPNMDAMRGLFTFNVDKLSSYQVGSTEPNAGDPLDLSDIVSLSSPMCMQQHIHKLDLLIVSIDRRLQAVENFLSKEGSESPSETESTVKDHSSIASQHGQRGDISHETDTDLFNCKPRMRQENGMLEKSVTIISPEKTSADSCDVTCSPMKNSNARDIRARAQSRGTPQHTSEILQRGQLLKRDSIERGDCHQRYSKSSKGHLLQDGKRIEEQQDMEMPSQRSKRKRLITDNQ
ncbi:hypothetical protein ACJMK2_030140 [Sinanodonta woodiana]|uniref:Mis18 domain-containing protein n=1 Tax=Sinanodonta woodiana TaxID=1069815 RepID=A0ABD3XFX8_SINWO